MKQIKVITISGNAYKLPEDMDNKTRTQLAALLLQLQQLDGEHDKDWKTYSFESESNLMVSFGTREVYESKVAALVARDTRNAEIERQRATETA